MWLTKAPSRISTRDVTLESLRRLAPPSPDIARVFHGQPNDTECTAGHSESEKHGNSKQAEFGKFPPCFLSTAQQADVFRLLDFGRFAMQSVMVPLGWSRGRTI